MGTTFKALPDELEKSTKIPFPILEPWTKRAMGFPIDDD
jgi:hypothetical protein